MLRRTRVRTTLTLALLAATFLTACEQSPPPPPPKPAAAPAPAAAPKEDVAAIQSMLQETGSATMAPGAALPPGHPPVPGAAPSAVAAPAGGADAELQYEPAADWKAVAPASALRKAQYALPRAEGDEEDGELIVFFFGRGEGGSVENNIARWRGQFTQPDGEPLGADAGSTETFDAESGLKVTLLDVSGRFAPGAMPGAPVVGPRDNYRMFAAVVETPGGPWFFKATGPARTMEKHRDALKALLAGAKYPGRD